jgi:hypothetical protein
VASDFRHAGHATFLLKIREGNHPTPDITVHKNSGILYFTYITSSTETDTSSLAPRRQRGSPFYKQQAQELSEGK